MGEKAQPIIIKKVKGGGHAAAHGGAWKVAYADFMTAMMMFFLVMWLMGSDEETKAAISHYFNNPTSAWRTDLTSKEVMPLGDRTGAGENILTGAEGQAPEDLVQRPMKPYSPDSNSGTNGVSKILGQMLTDESIMSLDMVRFSIPEEQLFKAGTSDQFAPEAEDLLNKVGQLAEKYKGYLAIKSFYDQDSADYELEMSRAVAVSNYLTHKEWTTEEHVKVATRPEQRPSTGHEGAAPHPGRKMEFTLQRSGPELQELLNSH